MAAPVLATQKPFTIVFPFLAKTAAAAFSSSHVHPCLPRLSAPTSGCLVAGRTAHLPALPLDLPSSSSRLRRCPPPRRGRGPPARPYAYGDLLFPLAPPAAAMAMGAPALTWPGRLLRRQNPKIVLPPSPSSVSPEPLLSPSELW